ncbi:hypothetical protein [Haloarcula laminariae]|uniref:hypothetical protein n=1 Tax=Haloarcula laminariae TaxID=2961577 RepID=UPI0024056E93|nr:hypothetical protein [Halomicroarcula sp. FL173]
MTRRSSTTDENSLKRRTFFTTAGAAAIFGLAGCSGSSPDETGSDSGDGDSSGGDGSTDARADGPFGDIGFEDGELTVGISDDAVAAVNAFREDELIGSEEVPTGASEITVFSADRTFHGEAVRLVAVDDEDNEIDSTTESFAADPSVSRVRSQAAKNDRPMTEEAANEYSGEFTTALVTIENAGDGPLFVPQWGFKPDTSVYLTDGVATVAPASAADDRLSDPSDHVLVPAGGTAEVVPFFPNPRHLYFEPDSGGENEEWPESIRSMGEWPDGYADGDEVDVPVTIEDDRGERVTDTVTVTYSGGMFDIGGPAAAAYTPGSVTTSN